MSATGRGYQRHKDDFYRTPTWATRSYWEYRFSRNFDGKIFSPLPQTIYDPCCGDGRILRALVDASGRPDIALMGSDIVQRWSDDKEDYLPAMLFQEDVFADRPTVIGGGVDTMVITNPPFALAEEILTHLVFERRFNRVAALLRLNFMGGPRVGGELFCGLRACKIFVLPNRPSFTGFGTDATEYAWFEWQSAAGVSTIEFLPPVPSKVRNKETMEIRKLYLADGGKPPKKKVVEKDPEYGKFNPDAGVRG